MNVVKSFAGVFVVILVEVHLGRVSLYEISACFLNWIKQFLS